MPVYEIQFEDDNGGTKLVASQGQDIAAVAAEAANYADENDLEVRWIAESGWTEGLV